MSGEMDLRRLLASMQPQLHAPSYVFCTVEPSVYAQLRLEPLGMFREDEGITVVLEAVQAETRGLPFTERWACITLTVHSALAAVGFLAAISTGLAKAGISVNPIAGYYHDHLFVPWERRAEVLDVLWAIQRDAQG